MLTLARVCRIARGARLRRRVQPCPTGLVSTAIPLSAPSRLRVSQSDALRDVEHAGRCRARRLLSIAKYDHRAVAPSYPLPPLGPADTRPSTVPGTVRGAPGSRRMLFAITRRRTRPAHVAPRLRATDSPSSVTLVLLPDRLFVRRRLDTMTPFFKSRLMLSYRP